MFSKKTQLTLFSALLVCLFAGEAAAQCNRGGYRRPQIPNWMRKIVILRRLPIVPYRYPMMGQYPIQGMQYPNSSYSSYSPANSPQYSSASVSQPPVRQSTLKATNRLKFEPKAPLAKDQQVRMKYLKLSVPGLTGTAQRQRVEYTLQEIAGVKGVSIKKEPDYTGTVKIWYSANQPVDTEVVMKTMKDLGWKAKQL